MAGISPIFNILKEFRQLGCSDETRCSAAYRLYIHLCEKRHLWDVQYHYAKHLDIVYLTARKEQDSPADIYIPVPTFDDVTMGDIDRYQAELTDPTTTDNRTIIIAFCDPSSSVLLYKMTNTIKPMEDKPPSKNKLSKQRFKVNRTDDL
ncbi:AAEL001556-PA [Aedes aegypti]|uniref:AAEL001556-PA n=2 Tax=Aedes aegypti TaxID=7159 RepID=A0A1S4EZ38_AEDAE|nr:uncharacterized protein LOC5571295 isoform X2 [Aedes aegypti]EAT47336.1 AAEL001556-PA [Aedes aegypti]